MLINETAARDLGWDSPVGKRQRFESGETLSVIGVVEDFNSDGMQRSSVRWKVFRSP